MPKNPAGPYDKRHNSMQDGPPTCSKCGGVHWRYWSCEKAAEKMAVEAANTAAREEQSRGKAVIPHARTHLPRPQFTSQNFVMQAPGVYRRVRGDDA